MAGRKKRGQKKQNKNNKKKSSREEQHVEEQHVEELSTENDSDDLAAHGNDSDHVSAHENDTDHQSASSQECQPLPPDELYFKNTAFTQTCKIQSKCYVTKTVKFLKKPKFKHELEWFENHSQFCHFFHMPEEPNLKLLGMWMLLLRTVPLHEQEDTAWFAVNGVPIRYSIREHALISGLDCCEYPPKYKKIGSFEFVDRHFKSYKEITMKSVKEKLLSMSACGDRLKMAILYFLGTIIRAKGRYNAPFDSFILRIVNDVEVCETFPWGRLTFDDAIRSITHVMKHLKGKPKKNVNFPGFIIPLEVLAFECIPVLNTEFREHADGCLTNCPRMCKKRFQSNSMKGYPLEDLYRVLGETKVINSVLVPTLEEEPLMARIMEGEPDYENEEGVSNLWSTWLAVKEKPIFWQELFDLDVAAREFPKKNDKGGDKGKVNKEASSSNANLEDVLKVFEERLMTCLSEVIVKVEIMDKRLGVLEKNEIILKRRSKRMKAMEKRLEGIKKKVRKQKTMEGRLDDIEKKLKKKENENSEGFDYQNMDFEWDRGCWDKNKEETRGDDEKESEKEAEKEEKEPEVEAETEEDKESEEDKECSETDEEDGWTLKQMMEKCRAQAEKLWKDIEDDENVEESEAEGNDDQEETEGKEKQDEVEGKEVQEEARAEKESMKTLSPPGRTKAAAARRASYTTAEDWIKMMQRKLKEQKAEEKLEEPEREIEKMVEEKLEEPEKETEEMVEEKVEEPAEEAQKMVMEEEVEEPEEEAEEMVEDEVEKPEKEARQYTEEEKQEWYMVVYEGSTYETKEASKPARAGIKHRPKQMALRKHAPKLRGRPRKAAQPKKFTTPAQTRRIRTRSQWISSPFTEANTDEIEGRKKKPRTKT